MLDAAALNQERIDVPFSIPAAVRSFPLNEPSVASGARSADVAAILEDASLATGGSSPTDNQTLQARTATIVNTRVEETRF